MTGYFAELERELLAAAERQRDDDPSPQSPRTSRRFGGRRLRVAAVALAVSEGCGGAPPGSLKVATVSGGSLRQNGLAFGMAPDQAVRVRVEARGVAVTVETADDNAGLNGRFYVAELPIRKSLGPTTVVALDSEGTVIGKTTLG